MKVMVPVVHPTNSHPIQIVCLTKTDNRTEKLKGELVPNNFEFICYFSMEKLIG